MNITKAFCLSIALFGASNMQAITNSDFVIQQDNTKINNYQTNRPEASKRLFVSQAVEQQIAHIKQLLTNARLAWMFENCFPNTLDTTVHFDGKDDTFCLYRRHPRHVVARFGCTSMALRATRQQRRGTEKDAGRRYQTSVQVYQYRPVCQCFQHEFRRRRMDERPYGHEARTART